MADSIRFIAQRCRQKVALFWRQHMLQIVLWPAWTLMICAVGFWQWHGDHVAHHLLNERALIIHALVAGIIGLVMMTKLEMWIEPWRFMD